MTNSRQPIIEVTNLRTYLGGTWVNDGLSLKIVKGEVIGIAGGSGSGKTTLLREMLMLLRPNSGSVKVFNQELTTATPEELLTVQRRWGVLFQQNALFSSLNVLENVSLPLKEQTDLEPDIIKELALLKIMAVGLPEDAAFKYPAELSGGMEKEQR